MIFSPVAYDPFPCGQVDFCSSETVRKWRVLAALASHPAGDYRANPRQLQNAFDEVIAGVRTLSIKLAYVPGNGVWMDVPPIDHPLYLQALVYWCSEFDCSLEIFSDAYASAGARSLIHDVYLHVTESKRRASASSWMKTLRMPTVTAETIPMQPPMSVLPQAAAV